MKNTLWILLLVFAICGIAAFLSIGLPLFAIRNNKTFEFEKEDMLQKKYLELPVNYPITGETISLRLFHNDERLPNWTPICVVLNISFLEWDIKMTKTGKCYNGHCSFRIPSSLVSPSAIIKSLEVHSLKDTFQIDRAHLFIGKDL